MAHLLSLKGFDVRVLRGGFNAWVKAGHPVEEVPEEDRLILPSFS